MHRDLAGGRWQTFTLVEQLSHVGSEVDRAIRSWSAGRSGRFEAAFVRALELFDLTAADARWRGSNRREILRLREEFCLLFPSRWDFLPESARSLQRYFLQLAVVARRIPRR
ncbi:MAG: hypothetical protein ACE5HZ_07690 [Fidelibacterota bacterium]